MKSTLIHVPASSSIRRKAGFTLIEPLTVIAIIVMLAAITLGILNMAQKKGAKATTEAQMELLKTGLERYEKEYAEFPEPIDNTGEGSGGAEALYQALAGDGTDAFVTGSESPTASTGEIGSSGSIFLPELDPKNPKHGMVNDQYQVVDPFGQRWRYRIFLKDDDDKTNNRTFDLWSTYDGPEKDNEARWIKNW